MSGNIYVIQNASHLNAASLFINELLLTAGQTAFTGALGQFTRRLDMAAQWTKEFGYGSAKVALIPGKYHEMENGSEEMALNVRKPAMKQAGKLFQ